MAEGRIESMDKSGKGLWYEDGLSRLMGMFLIRRLTGKTKETEYEIQQTMTTYGITAKDRSRIEKCVRENEICSVQFRDRSARNAFLMEAMEILHNSGTYKEEYRKLMEQFCDSTKAGRDYLLRMEKWIGLKAECEKLERELRGMRQDIL